MLEPFVQPLKRAARFLKFRHRIYLHETKLLRQLPLCLETLATSQTQNPQRILFNINYHWFYSWIDYLLAFLLKKRGHQIKAFICDGMPYCEFKTVTTNRPSCQVCFSRTARNAKAFGLDIVTQSSMLTDAQRHAAKTIALTTNVADLTTLTLEGINLGLIAQKNLHHYYKGQPRLQGQVEKVFREMIESALIVFYGLKQTWAQFPPDLLVTPNGTFIQSGIAVEIAKAMQKSYVSWEVFTQNTQFIIGKNRLAQLQSIDDLWPTLRETPLNESQRQALYDFYKLQQYSKNTPFAYYNAHVNEDVVSIKQQLALNAPYPIFSLFPNVEWDSTAMGLEGPFQSLADWVFACIDFARSHPHCYVIVRAHPGESKVPEALKTRTTLIARIRQHFQTLPENVRLIHARENISSYALAHMSQGVMVYSSTLGIEFALKGLKPWVASMAYYRDKGFTIDIQSKEHMYQLMDAQKSYALSEEEIQLAERFAYAVRFRRTVHFPLFENGDFSPAPLNRQQLRLLNNIADVIDSDRPCIDLNEQ